MPKFEKGGSNPLEYVISWQCSLEPPPLLLRIIASLDTEADLLIPLVSDGQELIYMSNALFS